MSRETTVRQTRVDIGGLDCADCAKTLERRISDTPGVASCSVQFGAGNALIDYDPAQVTTGSIASRIQDLGYTTRFADTAREAWTFDIHGMDCADCARTLEESVSALAGVQDADVTFATGRMRVQADRGAVSPADVIAEVERVGYRAAMADAEAAVNPPRRLSRRTIEIGIATALATAGLLSSTILDVGLVSPLLHVAAAAIAGYPVARAARASIQVRRADMNLLMTVAALGAIGLQDWAEASSLMVLFAIGLQLQSATIDRTRGAIRELMSIAPAVARVIRSGSIETVPVEQVAVGELIEVLPGERVPIDGAVMTGSSAVDLSAITGESIPASVEPGSDVISGSINGDGRITVRATSPGSDTTVSRIIHLVEAAHKSRAPVQALVERFAAIYTPVVIAGAIAIALAGLLATGGDRDWIYRGLILLVVACPCALVISTPVAFVSALGRASKMGVLFKGGSAIEALASIRQLAFDKTGTLTHGRPAVVSIDAWNGHDTDALLALAAAVEVGSTHPVARGIVRAAEGMSLPEVTAIEARPGIGAIGYLDGSQVQVGRASLFSKNRALAGQTGDGAGVATEVYVGRDGVPEGVIRLADSLRPSAPAMVRAIRILGIHPFILSGDSQAVAAEIGRESGIDDIRAGLLPADKARLIGEADRQSPVAMVGDGINDAPALAAARVGIAMGAGGSAVAIEAADIALMGDDLAQLPRAIGLARSTRRVVQENIAFALVSKTVFLGLTVGGYTSLWLAVAADVGAS